MQNKSTTQTTETGSLSINRVKQWECSEPLMAVHGWFLEIAWKDITCR